MDYQIGCTSAGKVSDIPALLAETDIFVLPTKNRAHGELPGSSIGGYSAAKPDHRQPTSPAHATSSKTVFPDCWLNRKMLTRG